MKERLQKLLAGAGVESRRHVEEMIRQGRVAVNGKIRVDLPILIDPDVDRVEVDGERIMLGRRGAGAEKIYILLNKPKNVHTTNVAQGEQLLAIDLLPRGLPERVFPVGRLDSQAKGLLLLTNDGELTHQLTHPRFGVPKTYRAVVAGFVPGEALEGLSKGIWLSDPHSGGGYKTGKTQLEIIRRTREFTVLEITMREGRNVQIRRMLARFGHKVKELTRVKFGPLTLDGLSPGESRLLTPRELRLLKKAGAKREIHAGKSDSPENPEEKQEPKVRRS
jgi:pseudouridine synthase